MKKILRLKFFLIPLFGFFISCTSSFPNQGVEAGNPNTPNVQGKKVTLYPQQGENTFVIEFETQSDALVTKIHENDFESSLTAYQIQELLVWLATTFSDGTQIALILALNESSEFISAELTINGESVPVSLESKTLEMTCEGTVTAEILQIINSLCSRIVTCNTPQVSCGACQQGVFEDSNLAHFLGADPGMSWQDVVDGMGLGDWVVNPQALEACLDHLTITPCSLVNQGYDVQDPDNYSTVQELLPKPSCAKGILKKKP